MTKRELTKKKNPIKVSRFTTSAVHMYLLTDVTSPVEVSPLMSIKMYRSCNYLRMRARTSKKAMRI